MINHALENPVGFIQDKGLPIVFLSNFYKNIQIQLLGQKKKSKKKTWNKKWVKNWLPSALDKLRKSSFKCSRFIFSLLALLIVILGTLFGLVIFLQGSKLHKHHLLLVFFFNAFGYKIFGFYDDECHTQHTCNISR